jgi:hypothetical protein
MIPVYRRQVYKSNLIYNTMKKLFLCIVAVTMINALHAQRSVDALFDKYAGKQGFTTVTLNGSLLKFAGCNDENGNNSLPAKVTEIRILSQEDDSLKVDNFYDMVMKDIDLSQYEEFMRVKESDQDLRMLVRAEGNRFKEFLMVGGGSDNVIIQIKGDMSLEEAQSFSKDGGGMVE